MLTDLDIYWQGKTLLYNYNIPEQGFGATTMSVAAALPMQPACMMSLQCATKSLDSICINQQQPTHSNALLRKCNKLSLHTTQYMHGCICSCVRNTAVQLSTPRPLLLDRCMQPGMSLLQVLQHSFT